MGILGAAIGGLVGTFVGFKYLPKPWIAGVVIATLAVMGYVLMPW